MPRQSEGFDGEKGEDDDNSSGDMNIDTPDLFWKATVMPNEELEVGPVEDYFVLITNACLGPDANKNTRTCLEVAQSSDEPSETKGIICTLKNNYENHQLNLVVNEDLRLSVAGENPSPIHLVGYLSPPDKYLNENPYDIGGDLMGEDDDEMVDEDAEMEMIKQGVKASSKRKFAAVGESDEKESIQPASKKQKKNGTGKPTQNQQAQNNQNNKNQSPKEKAKGGAVQDTSPKNTPDSKKTIDLKKTPQSQKKEWKSGVDGLTYQDIHDGKGDQEVKEGSTVRIYFAGQLPTNDIFDKNLAGQGLEFKVGEGKVIEGWEKGLLGMKVGAKRKLKVPARLAYGEKGLPAKVPPNTDVTFTIEIKSVN